MTEDFEERFADALAGVPDEHFDRSRFVPGVGPLDADVVLVGEAPGETEVAEGAPFVGQAGRVLDETLAGLGVDREAVYVTNVVKTRPPENRDPRRGEIEAWWPVLAAELDAVDPAVVVAMGNTATRELVDRDASISDVHGRRFEVDGRTVVPTFHPAATLYDRSKLPQFRRDLEAALDAT